MNFFRCVCTRKSAFGLPWGTSLSALGPGVKISVHLNCRPRDPPLCPRPCPPLLRGVEGARAPAPKGAQSVLVKKNGRTGGRPSSAGERPRRAGSPAPERPRESGGSGTGAGPRPERAGRLVATLFAQLLTRRSLSWARLNGAPLPAASWVRTRALRPADRLNSASGLGRV